MNTHPASALHAALAVALVALFLAAQVESLACMGTPPPLCARTLVYAPAAAPDIVAQPGAPVNAGLGGLAYFNVLEAPPGACPSLRSLAGATLDVQATAVCNDPAGGAGELVNQMIVDGFSEHSVPLTFDAGPPRICTVTTTATATMTDGAVLTASNDTSLCLGSALPGDPNLPRLSLKHLGATNVFRVHPGDQASATYRITNNDQTETFTGKLSVSLVNASREPGYSGGGAPPDDGPYSVSRPVQGDNFPIGFTEDLVNGCLYIPRDHDNPAPSQLSKNIDLAPGESMDVDIYARPFGGCSDGSCGVAVATLDGVFSDLENGLACAGFVVAADSTVAPTYQWAQGGSAAVATTPPAGFVLDFIASPRQGQTVPLSFIKSLPTILVDDSELPASPIPTSFKLNDQTGRIYVSLGAPGAMLTPGGVAFSYSNDIQISPGAPLAFNFTRFTPGAPIGLEDTAPDAMIETALRPFTQSETDWFLDTLYQISGNVTYSDGQKQSLIIEQFEIGPGAFPNAFFVSISGQIPAGADGAAVDVFTIVQDLRGFARVNADFDTDGLTDDVDNCILEVNPNQTDSNGDGFGNRCDPDLNNDGIVNAIDLGQFRSVFFTNDSDADFDGNGVVNTVDLGVMKTFFFKSPGPSGVAQ